MTEDTCKSCFKTADMEPVEVKRDGKWVASTVMRCVNPECHAVREGTLADRLDHVRSVYGYKYFGDYHLSPEQNDAVWEAKAIAERVPVMLEALKRVYFEWDGEPEDMIHVQAAIATAEGRSWTAAPVGDPLDWESIAEARAEALKELAARYSLYGMAMRSAVDILANRGRFGSPDDALERLQGALSAAPVGVGLAGDELTDALAAAFEAGCHAVQENYQPDADPEFGEAARDYAAAAIRPAPNTFEVGKPAPYFCPACQAIPRAGYCKLDGCPTAPEAR